jgi:GNAT superfamily N-acetyltransferase
MDTAMRMAMPEDKPRVMRMIKDFFDDSGYQDLGEFNPDTVGQVVDGLILNETLIVTDGGMLGWVNFPVFVTGQQVSQELFWWVDKENRSSGIGRSMIKMAEEKAKEQGSTAMMMLYLDELEGEKVGKMYGRMGYKPRERTFMRSL